MKRVEIVKNFDAIIDFAGVEKFIDTPLKHYSSGMQLRLAFAVAAFLENEILIIDEVLAVGDAEFQKKCMQKMEDINHVGNRTVLFVSHNIAAIQSFCNKCAYLNQGRLIDFAGVKEITSKYIESQKSSVSSSEISKLFKNNKAILSSIKIDSKRKLNEFAFYRSSEIETTFVLSVLKSGKYNLSIHFKTIKNEMICNFFTKVYDLNVGTYNFTLIIPPNFLNDEVYKMDLFIVENASVPIEQVNDIVRFEIIDDSERVWFGKFEGVIRPDIVKFEKY